MYQMKNQMMSQIIVASKFKQRIKQLIPNSKYRKQQKQIRKYSISIVFNYSSIVLTATMEKALNKGLNFAIFPLNLGIAKILKDFRGHLCLKGFGLKKNSDQPYVQPMFKRTKTNIPSNQKVPNDVNVFLTSVKSKI